MSDLVSIPVAARFLEIPESAVKRLIRQGALPEGGRGSWNRILLRFQDVKDYATVQQLGRLGREMRTVHVVGDVDELVWRTMMAAGIQVERSARIVHVIANHPRPAPIIVADARAAAGDAAVLNEYRMLKDLGVITRLCVVGAEELRDVPWSIEQAALMRSSDDVSDIVRWCWKRIEQQQADRLLQI